MARKGFRCEVKLDIHLISSPGTRHLSNRNMMFLRIALLGSSKRTKSVYASFPLIFNERLYFERILVNAREPEQAMEILEDENVIIELLQYSERHQGGRLLAYYEQSSRKFLFPDRSLTKKDGMDREILLNRTTNLQGINPKLEFSTNTTMEEIRMSGSYGTFYEPEPAISDYDDYQQGSVSSENEAETTDVMHSTSLQLPSTGVLKHCVCECPRRPENHGHVVVKSRSLSPRLKRSKFTSRKSPHKKPPFKTGKADESIISRRDFPSSPTMKRRAKLRSSLPATPMPADGDPLPCERCRVPHKDCLVCQAYYKVYGKEFLQYRFGPDRRLRSNSTPSSISFNKTSPTVARARIPDGTPTADDIAYSRPLSRCRKNTTSNGSEGYSSYRDSSSQSDEMHEKVRRLLQKTKMYSNSESSDSENSETESDKDSLFSLQELRSEIDDARKEALDRSFEDPEHPTLGTRLNRRFMLLEQIKYVCASLLKQYELENIAIEEEINT